MSRARPARITLLRPPAVASVYAYSVPVVPRSAPRMWRVHWKPQATE